MKGGGQTPLWKATAICETSKTSWQMEKTPYERRFGEPFKGPIIPSGATKCSRGEVGKEIF